MKTQIRSISIIFLFIFLFSCGGYKTHVINIINKDGSIFRKVTMQNDDPDFSPENYRVPVDSTWTIEITSVIKDDDTTWTLSAEKLFNSVDEINEDYKNDQGANQGLPRSASFTKKFRWFNTVYRFSEKIEQTFNTSTDPSEFHAAEELSFLYLPGEVQEDLIHGPDSSFYKPLSDSVEVKYEYWLVVSMIREWTEIFYDNFGDLDKLKLPKEEMQSKEALLTEQFIQDDLDEEETFNAILGEEFYQEFEVEIDSALSILEDRMEGYWDMDDYNLEIRMPGSILATNGYLSSETGEQENGIIWAVKGDFFLSQVYEMWVESQTTNYWAWIITGIFIVFVFVGFIRKPRVKA